MLTKIIRVMGIVLVVLFSAVSIFFSYADREFQNDDAIARVLSYPSYFEDRFYDFRANQTLKPDAYDDRIILAEIDDPTLQKIGRWPFSRIYWAEFINRMSYWGAKTVAFDVFFSEPEKACGEDNPDLAFTQSIADFQSTPGRKVIIPYSINIYGVNTYREFDELPEEMYNYIMTTQQNAGLNLKKQTVSKDVWPIPKLFEAEPMLGHIQADADPDGIYRQYQVVSNVEDLYFPGFALAAYQVFTDDEIRMDYLVEGDAKVVTKHGEMSLNLRGETKVRWLGDRNAFPRIPVHEILHADPNDEKLKKMFQDKLVMVGSTAYGAHDLRHTPVADPMPGIFFHMNMANMLLDGRYYKPEANSVMFSWLILLGGTLIIVIFQLFGKPVLDIAVVSVVVGGVYYVDTFHLTPMGYEIRLFFCLFCMLSSYSWNTFLNFYLSNKDKAFLKNAFGNYISPELIEEMY